MGIQVEKSLEWPQWQEWQRTSQDSHLWTEGDYAIDHITWLDAVVRNSGWIDVLVNSADGYLDDVVGTLRAIGADETLGILQRCMDRFPDGRPSNNAQERDRQIQALSREDRCSIDSLDEEYYSSTEDVCGMAVKYWRRCRKN